MSALPKISHFKASVSTASSCNTEKKTTTRQASPKQNLAQSSTPVRTGSHLVDVLQQVQSLFEVVLVGPSVVVADVQLQRGRHEEVGAGLVHRNRIKKEL